MWAAPWELFAGLLDVFLALGLCSAFSYWLAALPGESAGMVFLAVSGEAVMAPTSFRDLNA